MASPALRAQVRLLSAPAGQRCFGRIARAELKRFVARLGAFWLTRKRGMAAPHAVIPPIRSTTLESSALSPPLHGRWRCRHQERLPPPGRAATTVSGDASIRLSRWSRHGDKAVALHGCPFSTPAARSARLRASAPHLTRWPAALSLEMPDSSSCFPHRSRCWGWARPQHLDQCPFRRRR